MKSKVIILLICISALSSVLSVYLLVHRQTTFMSGLNAGLVESAQGQIVSSFIGLEMLNKVTGNTADAYKTILVNNINTQLVSLSFFENQVKVRPLTWKILVNMNTSTWKDFFKKLQAQRILHHWQSNDPNLESKIQHVIDRYIRYGNLYGL